MTEPCICQDPPPGAVIPIRLLPTGERTCIRCGRLLTGTEEANESMSKWDKYFLNICNAVSSKSPCHSRNIGAIIVRDHSIVSTGYNGPARGYPHCTPECPRRAKKYKSGEGLHECPAAHAETNAIVNAARLGVSVRGCILYLNTVIPCKDCAVLIVNAGIVQVVSVELTPYHEMSLDIFRYGKVKLRRFEV